MNIKTRNRVLKQLEKKLAEVTKLLEHYNQHEEQVPKRSDLQKHFYTGHPPKPKELIYVEKKLGTEYSDDCKVTVQDVLKFLKEEGADLETAYVSASCVTEYYDEYYTVNLNVGYEIQDPHYQLLLEEWELSTKYADATKLLRKIYDTRIKEQEKKDRENQEYEKYLKLKAKFEKKGKKESKG